jgi:hypothetical protein
MQTVFLKDGTQANLITKTEKGYVVDPFETYQDYEGEQGYSEPSGNLKLVEKVYEVAPRTLIDAEYEEIVQKVEAQEKLLSEKRAELRQAQNEIDRIKGIKTDTSRYIINREELRNAKRLILWPRNYIAPRVMDGSKSHKFTVSYDITQYNGEEKAWASQLWSEDKNSNWGNSEYFDEQYGIKVDLTDEQILALTHQRIERFKKEGNSWRSTLLRTADEWLTPEYIEEKNAIKADERKHDLDRAEKEFKEAQAKYESLQKSLTVS